jgi:SiaC family regulatory phosphoprotein
MIKKIHIAATEDTPEIILDQEKGVFQFTGRALPENVNTLFLPIFEWFNEYFNSPLEETIVSLNLEYLNSATSKKIVELLLLLEKVFEKGTKVKVVWYYKKNDFIMQKKGNDLIGIFKIPNDIISL